MENVKVNSEGIVESFEYFPAAEKLKILDNLKPFFEDSANYFGIYEEDVENLCRKMGWNRTEQKEKE